MAVRRKLLLLMKPFDIYPLQETVSRFTNPQELYVYRYLQNRLKVHKEAINFCQDVLRNKLVEWRPVFRNDISHPISDVDLVVTVGGDGTLLQASHLIGNESIPVIGVNSDPTQVDEVQEYHGEFDATRSTGYLCAATVNNFERVIDDVIEGISLPSQLSRMSISVNKRTLPTYALNDVLIAHPCPASVSRFSFKITGTKRFSPTVHCRSSGLRVSTAAGSTAAMLSAGGFPMAINSDELQYMVREPISAGKNSGLMHGLVKSDQSMDLTWFCKEGVIYIDGSHVRYSVKTGDTLEISSKAPGLNVFLPHHLLPEMNTES